MTNTTKTTKAQHLIALTNLIAAAMAAGIEGYDFEGLNTYVENEKTLLANKAAAAKARAEKQKAEGDELRDTIKNLLNAETFTTIPELVKVINDESVTPQKITPRLSQLIKLGLVEKGEVTIEGTDGKSRKINGYRVIGG